MKILLPRARTALFLAFSCFISVFFFACLSSSSDGAEPQIPEPAEAPDDAGTAGIVIDTGDASLSPSEFSEVWAYLVAGREHTLRSGMPLTDVVYFGAEVDRYGHIADIPSRKKLADFKGRVHVSIACNSAGLTHFILEPGSRARKIFVDELLYMASQYDGLNIDMEQLPLRDADNFISFLGELRKGLGKKMLSVCVPARASENQTYNYVKLTAACDRVFVMAYDEHWSSSAPGPVASMSWCRAVAAYALQTMGKNKLVMGIPFYGRGWGDKTTSRALVHSTTQNLRNEFGITQIERENGIPKFTYEVVVKVTVYFEDLYSLTSRMKMYNGMGINHIGFWCLGQEDTAIWRYINAGTVKTAPPPAKSASAVKAASSADASQFKLNDILRARDAAGFGGLSRAEMEAVMNKSFTVNGVTKTFREWQNIINTLYGIGKRW